MPEYTQEQIDTMLSEAKAGLFTKAELDNEILKETDRRVETGIQKGLETHKQKWQKEFEEKAKLSAEELAHKEFAEKEQFLTLRELETQKKENKLLARELLSKSTIAKDKYEGILDLLISQDIESTEKNVKSFIDVFNKTKLDIETEVKTALSTIKNPKVNDAPVAMTMAEFNKLSYVEKVNYKKTYPEEYKTFIK